MSSIFQTDWFNGRFRWSETQIESDTIHTDLEKINDQIKHLSRNMEQIAEIQNSINKTHEKHRSKAGRIQNFISDYIPFCCSKREKLLKKTNTRLIHKSAKLYKGGLYEFIEDKRSQSPNYFKKPLFHDIEKRIKRNIEYRKDVKGYTWEITNTHRQKHYLIGTIHLGNQAMIENPDIIQTVEKSDEFIGEVHEDFFNSLIYKIYSLNPFNKLNKCLDFSIIELAKKKGASVKALETAFDQKSAYDKASNAVHQNPFKKFFYDYPSTQQYMTHHDENYECVDGYQEGSLENAIRVAKLMHNLYRKYHIEERNHLWLNGPNRMNVGLIKHLRKNQSKVTCIFVGALHCIGSNGIIALLQKEGFEVKKI